MPDRVKCLHVLIAHSLAKGPGLNPFGDESVALAAQGPLRGTAIPADWPQYTGPEHAGSGEAGHTGEGATEGHA
jgi:hypothetical protein